MPKGSGGGGRPGRSGGGGGSPTDYTVTSVEFLAAEKPFGTGADIVKVKSGQYTYAEGKEFSGYKKAISEGKLNIENKDIFGEMKYFKTKDEAISAAKKEFRRSF